MVTLDAEKAFNSVRWTVLCDTLKWSGLHKSFIKGIHSLNSKAISADKNKHLNNGLYGGNRQNIQNFWYLISSPNTD